jgi:DNA polymerase V
MSIFALVDGNNFFVSCHRAIQPNLKGKPVVVLSHDGGIIIARSNEAKALGIKMAQPVFKIKRLLDSNNVICLLSNHQLYKDTSLKMMGVFRNHSPKIQEYSIDEAFLDFTGVAPTQLEQYGHDIKNDVMKTLKIPVCVGFAKTKTLAKFANHMAKTYDELNSVYSFYDHERLRASLGLISIDHIWGIGAANEKKLKGLGIQTALDLANLSPSLARRHLNLMGERVYEELNGRVCSPLEITKEPQKSIMESRTMLQSTSSKEKLHEEIAQHVVNVTEKIRSLGLASKDISIFIATNKHNKGPQHEKTMKVNLPRETNITKIFLGVAHKMLEEAFRDGYQYKKAGVTISNLKSEDIIEEDLFTREDQGQQELKSLTKSMDELNQRFGKNTIVYGATGPNRLP